MVLLPPWLRDEADYIVDDKRAIELACQATGVYDKEYWYSGEVPDEVWTIIDAELDDEIAERLASGASWKAAVDRIKDRL